MQDPIDSSAYRADEDMRARVASAAAAATLVLLIPFLVYRVSAADWPVVVIIVAIITTMAFVIAFLRRGGSALLATYVVVGVYSVGAVAVTYVLDASALLWLYPLVVANFYCLPRQSALVVNTLVIGAATPHLTADPYVGTRILATLGLVFAFGWVFSRQLENQRHRLSEMALEDTLTGIGNRRALDVTLTQIHDASQRYGRHASLLLVDLDHFKRINDTFGHHVGDGVLKQVAGYLEARLRRSDRLFRYGGEEFVVLLPETRLAEAAELGNALREGCAELVLRADHPGIGGIGRLTLSAGVAELSADESPEAWLTRADEALYRAKAEGRNRVITAPPATGSRDASPRSAPR